MSSDWFHVSDAMIRPVRSWGTDRLECNPNLGGVGHGLGGYLFVLCRIDRSLAMLGGNDDKGVIVDTLVLQLVHDLAKRGVHEVNGFQ